MWLAGQILKSLRMRFSQTFCVAPSCIARPSYSINTEELAQKELCQSLYERNWLFEDFVSIGCRPILARQLQGLRKLSYLIVTTFLELLVDGLIGCQHDEAWDHEIENGQGKKECDIVSGNSEERKKKRLLIPL